MISQEALQPVAGLNNTTGSLSSTGGFLNPESIAGSFNAKENMRVADFGSGAGYFTIILGKLVGEGGLVTAIDIMENALDSVRSKAKSEGLKNIQTIKSNLEILGSTGLPDNSQDMVLTANVLFQSNKREEILREAHRVLRDRGELIIIDWKKSTGGLGPPDDLRIDSSAMQSLAMGVGFEFSGNINAGDFHYGLRFTKIAK